MARANLAVDSSLRTAFEDASSQRTSARAIRLAFDFAAGVIRAGDAIPLTADAAADFEALVAAAREGTSAMWLVRRDTMRWSVVSFIPDDAPVRDRMILASSASDLKAALGLGSFAHDFHASTLDEFNFAEFSAVSTEVSNHDDVLTEAERVKRSLDRDAAHGSDFASAAGGGSGGGSGGGGGGGGGGLAVGFRVAPALESAFEALAAAVQAERRAFAVVARVDVAAESLELVSTLTDVSLASAVSAVDGGEPRFALLHVLTPGTEGVVASLFYCPEAVPIKAKMVASTAKATVASHGLGRHGLAATKIVEARDLDDVRDGLRPLFEASAGGAGRVTNNDADGAGADEAGGVALVGVGDLGGGVGGFKKPAKPGRRK